MFLMNFHIHFYLMLVQVGLRPHVVSIYSPLERTQDWFFPFLFFFQYSVSGIGNVVKAIPFFENICISSADDIDFWGRGLIAFS